MHRAMPCEEAAKGWPPAGGREAEGVAEMEKERREGERASVCGALCGNGECKYQF